MLLHYEFPRDIMLQEVKSLIQDNENFIWVDRGCHTIVNYVRAGNETHPPVVDRSTAILHELRGLVFSNMTGKVISRRLHKFFNYGERQELMNLDLSKPHEILLKLDGSMITPIRMESGMVSWGTKMGVTDVAEQVIDFVSKNPKYDLFAQVIMAYGYTPIFEWCSRKQQIVVDYPEDQLVLIAVRDNITGRYIDLNSFRGQSADIPVVETVENTSDNFDDFVNSLKDRTDIEGVVVRFEDGHMVKIKTDHYIALHRVKSMIESERDVVNLILSDKVDDILPAFDAATQTRLQKYAVKVNNCIDNYLVLVNSHIQMARMDGGDRKKFALGTAKTLPKLMTSFVFSGFDAGKIDREFLVNFVVQNCTSNSVYEKCKAIIGVNW